MDTQKKHVLFIITKSNFGGAQRYVYDLATHLPPEYVSTVALGGTGTRGASTGSLKDMLEAKGIRTITIPHFMRDMSLMDDVQAFFELLTVVRREKPNILHVTSSKAGGIGAFAGRLCGVPRIIFTSHGLTFDESWRPWWQRMLIYLGTWCTILLSTHTIQISKDTYERAHKMPLVGKKVSLIHNGIEAPTFLSREEARQVLLPHTDSRTRDLPWIGSIAEYHPNKNLTILIEAVALLRTQGVDVRLILIGEDGDGRRALEETMRAHDVAERVHLLGRVSEASRYLKALDIFALPSRKEGLPYVLMEAGFAGIPCVVSNITGNTEIVTNNVSGVAVEATAEQFARTCNTLLTNHTLATHYGETLHEHVTTQFSVEHMLNDTVALYEKK